MKVKAQYTRDEYYPYYEVAPEGTPMDVDGVIEVDKPTLNRWMHVLAEFDQVQDEISKAVKDANRA